MSDSFSKHRPAKLEGASHTSWVTLKTVFGVSVLAAEQ